MAFSVRKALGVTSALGLVVSLAACGPDDMAVKDAGHFTLGEVDGPFDWPMNGYESALGTVSGDTGDWAPLAAARPMVARAPARYGYAPAWDYLDDYRYDAPEFASYNDGHYEDRYYDGGYYEDSYYDSPYFENAFYGPAGYDWYERSADTGTYALLALAALLGGVIGDSPPDYYFAYGDVQPWVWITEDRYVRYAEPLDIGYRYYYYAPDAVRPFLVRDPLYSYGYNDDRLVVIYGTYGRVLDRERALPLRRAASSYYDRAVTLYRTASTGDRYGVPAPLWQQRSRAVVADQQVWNQARNWNPGWRDWNKRYDKAADKHWQRERIARTYAAKRFAAWQDDGFRSAAPQPGRELRTRNNSYEAALRQAAVETRRQDMRRMAKQERVKAQGRSDRPGPLARGLVSPVRQTAASPRGGLDEARLQGSGRMKRQDNLGAASSGGKRREEVARGQSRAARSSGVERQAEAKPQRRDKVARERQPAREQRHQADVQHAQRTERQQAERQYAQRKEQVGRQQALRTQQAQARAQQREARQQISLQRQQRESRRQQMVIQQQANTQPQQPVQQQRQAFADGGGRGQGGGGGQGGQDRGHGRNDR